MAPAVALARNPHDDFISKGAKPYVIHPGMLPFSRPTIARGGKIAMGGDNEKTKNYRERAKQLRSIGNDVRSAADRKTLQAIARDFEQMATDAEVDRKQDARADAKGRK